MSLEDGYLGKKGAKAEEKLKGDKLRDLIFLVYLNNKYGKGENKISELEEIAGYRSPGGVYHALDSSGYFDRDKGEIKLTELGTKYLNSKILGEFRLANTVGNALIIISLVSLLQWIYWTYFHVIIMQWYAFIPLLAGGLFIRFFVLRINYWIIKKQRKIT
jgi:hypothetical protein